jgi:uncharacterized repeat protein (TIGR01451 family)
MRHFILLCLLLLARFAAAQSDFYVKFPDDINTTFCAGNTFLTPPQVYSPSGASVTIDYTDETITVVPDACYKIERNWVVKGPNFDPGLPCTYIPNPTPNAILNHPDNLPGPVVSPAGTPAPWVPTVVNAVPGAPIPTDFSLYWSSTANCYQYKQIIKVLDSEVPVALNCPAQPPVFQDTTPNSPQLWNAPYWFDPLSQNHDLSDAPVLLSISATDACAGNNLDIRYLLFLDLDGDGTMETAINSQNPPDYGQVNVGNASTPGFAGGTPQDFDQRVVTANQKYRFGIKFATQDTIRTATVGWNTFQSQSTWELPQLPAGTHKIRWFITDACGNDAVCEYAFTVLRNPNAVHTLRGRTLTDTDGDCETTPGDPVLLHWKTRLDRLDPDGVVLETEYGSIGADSFYYFQRDSGDYQISALPPNGYFLPCTNHLLTINTVGDTTQLDFPIQPLVECPFLETDIGTPFLRRCFDNTYTLRYCNTGTAAAEGAFIRVKLDPFLSFVSAQRPAVFEGNHTWRFDIGHIPMNECDRFTFVVNLDCDSTVLGQTHCVEAHIYPDSFCIAPSAWSGANVDVDGSCLPDSVRFVLRNTGTAATSLLEYIVIEDNIITRQQMFQLPVGDSMRVSVPANGSTWRLEAEQEPGNPGNPMPSATVEACGQNSTGGISIGFVPQFGEDDGDPFVSVDCQQSRGSYDPNDKQGWPLGYGPEHLIEPGQPLDYLIRFQNTGTDTAFTVVVRDTLAAWLHSASVRPGASSHPYQFALSEGGILSFRFENILLPDSNVHEAASHGFVKFRVEQRDSVPLGTLVTNRAGIYFDFNPPVMTNETQHRVGKEFVASSTRDGQPSSEVPTLRAWPNPAPQGATLRLENLSLKNAASASLRFELYDARGRHVLSRSVQGERVSLDGGRLPNGLYFFQVFEEGKMRGAGKVVVR